MADSTPNSESSKAASSEITQTTNSTQSSMNTVAMPKEEVYRLLRIELLHKIQNELDNWGKKRFWIIAVITAVIGFVGAQVIVQSIVQSRLKEGEEKIEKVLLNTVEKSVQATANALIVAKNVETVIANSTKRIEDHITESRVKVTDATERTTAITKIAQDAIQQIDQIKKNISDMESRASYINQTMENSHEKILTTREVDGSLVASMNFVIKRVILSESISTSKILNVLATSLAKLGDYERIEDRYDVAQQRYMDALESFEASYILDKNSSDIKFNIAELLALTCQPERAKSFIDTHIKEKPDDYEGHFYRGLIYQMISDNNISLNEYNSIFSRIGTLNKRVQEQFYFNLSVLHYSLYRSSDNNLKDGHFEKITSYLNESIKLGGRNRIKKIDDALKPSDQRVYIYCKGFPVAEELSGLESLERFQLWWKSQKQNHETSIVSGNRS